MTAVLSNVIRFSTILMMKHQCKDSKEANYDQAEISLKDIDEDLIETIVEEYLESVFGSESKMTRVEFLSRMTSDDCKWLLDSE